MRKILLFSIVFVVTGTSVIAQKKVSKKTVISQKKLSGSVKSTGSEQEKATVSKNAKYLDLQKRKLQPAIAPAELKDERAN